MTLDELDKEIAALRDALSAKIKARALLLSPFVEGDVIVNDKTRIDRGTFRVLSIHSGRFGNYGVSAVRIRKDGSDGAKVEIAFPGDFRKVSP